ncbi:NAD-binding protein [Microvirga massiliensis]|uniref:NAD-binding protein n=1 Tax=Microvirga massiliensis TaxID=1033741 RepID=UPI000660BBF4|nr:NAD-binding protein [Microvirga massiliensis]
MIPPSESVSLSGHAILVGHGRIGQIAATALRHHGLSYVVVEADRRLAEALRAGGTAVIYGDATREEVLEAAQPLRAPHRRGATGCVSGPAGARSRAEAASKD